MLKQTRFGTGRIKPNENISLPFGLMRTVTIQMRRLGLTDFLDSLKVKGVPLSTIVAVMCTYQLFGGSSMKECGEWISDPVAAEGLCGGYKISGKTIERSLDILSNWFDDVLDVLWRGINECYEITDTDVIINGSHVPLNGVKSKLAAYGYGGNGVQNQMQFMVAQLKDPPLPFRIESYAGNESDAVQFADFLPMIMRYLRKGSMIIMDNGGATNEVLNDIKNTGMEYLTRVKMNDSDDKWMAECADEFVSIDDDACCLVRTFLASERTVYLFFSVDKYVRSISTAEKKAIRLAEIAAENSFRSNKKIRKSDFLTMKRNPFVDVNVKLSVQRVLDPFDPNDMEAAIEELKGDRCGFFKLESSIKMSPTTALDVYRSRVAIEHLISSIKSVVKLKPMRVWKTSSMNGALLMALIAQLIISLTIVDMKGTVAEKIVHGKKVAVTVKPSPVTVVRSLGQLTVTYVSSEGKVKDRIFSNFDPLNTEIMGILDTVESDFGGRKHRDQATVE